MKPPLLVEKHRKGDDDLLAQGHTAAQGQTCRSGIQTPTSSWLVPGFPQSGSSAGPGVYCGFTIGVSYEARFHFMSEEISRWEKKKKQSWGCKLPADLAGSKSMLSPALHALAGIPRDSKTRAGFEGQAAKLISTFSTGKIQKPNPIFQTRSSDD